MGSRSEIAAVLDDDRQPHWADDFPAEGDRVIAGHIAAQENGPHPYGHRQIIERETALVVGAIGAANVASVRVLQEAGLTRWPTDPARGGDAPVRRRRGLDPRADLR